MLRKRLFARMTTLILIMVFIAPYFTMASFADDVPSTESTVESKSITIHLPGNADASPQWNAPSDTNVWVMTQYFSAGVHSISINCTVGYNVDVFLMYNGSYWAGKTLTSSAPGPWKPRISTAGYYSVYVHNNSNYDVDITLNVS